MSKIKSKYKKNAFGKSEIQLIYINDAGIEHPLFNIWKERGYYVNDTNGRYFKTVAEFKEYCLENIRSFITQP